MFILLCALILLLGAAVFFGGAIGNGVRNGLALSYKAVIPALFPTMILCGLIVEYAQFFPLPPAWTVWIVSQLCGFPMGIRTLSEAYRRGLIERDQAIRLSACCSNASPAFLILYVGETLLKSRSAGIRLWAAQAAISAAIGIALNAFEKRTAVTGSEKPILTAFCESVSAAAGGCLVLTGYVAAFSIFGAFLRKLPFLYALLEITGGLSAMDPRSYSLIAAAAGFSGLSVMMQNSSYLFEAKLPVYPMFIAKTVYALAMALPLRFPLTFWFLPVFAFFFDKWRKKHYNVKKGRTGVPI